MAVVHIDIPDYDSESGLRLPVVFGGVIEASIRGSELLIRANGNGLLLTAVSCSLWPSRVCQTVRISISTRPCLRTGRRPSWSSDLDLHPNPWRTHSATALVTLAHTGQQ